MVNFFVLTLFLIFVVMKDLPKRAGQNMSFMESATEKKNKIKKGIRISHQTESIYLIILRSWYAALFFI